MTVLAQDLCYSDPQNEVLDTYDSISGCEDFATVMPRPNLARAPACLDAIEGHPVQNSHHEIAIRSPSRCHAPTTGQENTGNFWQAVSTGWVQGERRR